MQHNLANNALTNITKQVVMSKFGMDEKQWAKYAAVITTGLFKLRTAYPSQTRNYSVLENDALTALWLETFASTDIQFLPEAIDQFIKQDKKGFFPSPGQILDFAEKAKNAHFWAEAEQKERLFLMSKESKDERLSSNQE